MDTPSFETPQNFGLVTFVAATAVLYVILQSGLWALAGGAAFGIAAWESRRLYIKYYVEEEKGDYSKMSMELSNGNTPRHMSY